MNKLVPIFRTARRSTLARFASHDAGSFVSENQQKLIESELANISNTYSSLPVSLTKGNGIYVWDVDGKRYVDMLSGYSALSLGHCPTEVLQAMTKQASRLHLTSRAFHNDLLGPYAEYVTKLFGYDRLLPMNTGVEACETAVKLARKWGYKVKNIPKNQAKVVFANNNFWGRSIAAVSSSTDPSAYENYGPFVPNFLTVPYNDISAIESVLEDETVCAVMLEPIQGEAGVIIPSPGYLQKVRDLCTKKNVLLIADEVQTGLGRTGKLLAVDHDGVKPDLVVLGKALSAGVYPVSAVLGCEDVMTIMEPGTHGSTFGGNPLSCAVAMSAISELQRRGCVENSRIIGNYALQRLKKCVDTCDLVTEARGRGLMLAFSVRDDIEPAWNICLRLRDAGILAKQTHHNTVRLAPPLIISEKEARDSFDTIECVLATPHGKVYNRV